MANAIRALAMDAVQKANSGHPGMPMGMADVATVLFRDFLKFDPKNPDWPDRDRFVLSAGHGSMLLYALLHLTGYDDMPIEELARFRETGSKTAGHPEYGAARGIETTTGPLGQGLANAVGMAAAEQLLAQRFSKSVVDHYTYVIVGDGCLMEGISHEAIGLAGQLGLSKLIVLFDDNGITIDGPTSLSCRTDQQARFRAEGFDVFDCDGHDPAAIARALTAAKASPGPALISCRTTIGFGSPNLQGTAKTHGAALGPDEVAATRVALGWPHPAFVIPGDVAEAWRTAGNKGADAYNAWQQRVGELAGDVRATFEQVQSGQLPAAIDATLIDFKRRMASDAPTVATRQASGKTLDVIAPLAPEMIGGSADLTGSNNTRAAGAEPIEAAAFGGTYLHYGIREHGMAAMMNGMALHGGIVPFGGTFLVFSDYCRPAIRLAALMGIRSIFVMTHDSIGLGEDGPTHQPVEQLAALRAIPNLNVLRPADIVETAECWQIALAATSTPSLLALTRQGLKTFRTAHSDDNLSAKGGYIAVEAEYVRQAVIVATGSEVSVAIEARALLEAEGIGTRVVSLPSFELFAAQSADYRNSVIPRDSVTVGVEAAVGFGWDKILGDDGVFVGMTGFGASGPQNELFEHFGITAEAVAETVRRRF